jgi:hypothetical protein
VTSKSVGRRRANKIKREKKKKNKWKCVTFSLYLYIDNSGGTSPPISSVSFHLHSLPFDDRREQWPLLFHVVPSRITPTFPLHPHGNTISLPSLPPTIYFFFSF